MGGRVGADTGGSGNKFYEFHFAIMGIAGRYTQVDKNINSGRYVTVAILPELHDDRSKIHHKEKRPECSAEIVAELGGALRYVNSPFRPFFDLNTSPIPPLNYFLSSSRM